MPKNLDGSKNEAADMIRWMAVHPKIQRMLCVEDYDADPEECLEIIAWLEEQGFYTLIYVLLLKNKYQRVIGTAIERYETELWANEWQEKGDKWMCENLKTRIKAEMGFQELKKKKVK